MCYKVTSSLLSVPSLLGAFGLRANLPTVIPARQTVFSLGGPPHGLPLIIKESPERT